MNSQTEATGVTVLDGQTIEYRLAGSGAPTIVLVNGAGGPIGGWLRVLPALESIATVLAYNRAGIGKSAQATRPQTSLEIVSTLRALLAAIGLAPPYLLVGHSLGGLHVNLFARAHPAEVQAVVLLEATAPGDVVLMNSSMGGFQRALNKGLDALFGKEPLGEVAQALASAASVERAGAFPPLPLRVITGAKPALRWLTPALQLQGRAEHQRMLAAMSPFGKQVIATRSGHFPQFTEPGLVVQVIRELAAHSSP